MNRGLKRFLNRQFKVLHELLGSSRPESRLDRPQFKIKQGLSGYSNGRNVSALADTGSRKNVISASYAECLGLEVTGSPCEFELGNSQKTKSIGKYRVIAGRISSVDDRC